MSEHHRHQQALTPFLRAVERRVASERIPRRPVLAGRVPDDTLGGRVQAALQAGRTVLDAARAAGVPERDAHQAWHEWLLAGGGR